MADIYPFRALRYDTGKVSTGQVVTQPYDKISPAMQDRYYAASPYNLVRIILGKSEPGDGDGRNVYTRAAGFLKDWRNKGVLRQDEAASLYLYTQRFKVPASAARDHGRHLDGNQVELERRGFIAAGKLHDYAEGVVFRHEQTLSKPKADRLNLLRATHAHFGQIFMLYSDPNDEVGVTLRDSVLSVAPGGTRQSDSFTALAEDPDMEATDEYGVVHRVWAITDPQVIARVQMLMRDKKLIIADGHHRYETALNYRNECRKSGNDSGDAPFDRVMMTFVNMDAPGLVILPTHRVVFGLKNFSQSQLVEGAKKYFEVEKLSSVLDGASAARALQQGADRRSVLVAVTADGAHRLTAKAGAADSLLQEFSPDQRTLDVVQLHKVLLEKVLGISEEAIRNQENISYHREADEAIGRLKEGAQIAFLMNPVRIQQMRDIAFAGGVMPQKSTDFFPKLLSGLTIYSLE